MENGTENDIQISSQIKSGYWDNQSFTKATNKHDEIAGMLS